MQPPVNSDLTTGATRGSKGPLDLPPKFWSSRNVNELGQRKGVLGNMARRKHSPEQVINKLRQAEVAIAEGCTVAEASRQIGVTQQTFYRWRTEYGGLRIDQARRLKQLEAENTRLPPDRGHSADFLPVALSLRIDQARRPEAENTRLKRAVADLTVDNQMLKEAAAGNY